MPAPVTRADVNLIMGLMERARGRDTNDTVLRHPITTLLLGLVLAGFMGAITVWSIIAPDLSAPVCGHCGHQHHHEYMMFMCFTFMIGALVYCFYYSVRDDCPVRYLLYGWVGSVILAALNAWVPRVGLSVFFLAWTLPGVLMLWGYFKKRHRLEPGGLCYRTPLAGSGTLRWSEVEKVYYAQKAGWFRLVTRQGNRLSGNFFL